MGRHGEMQTFEERLQDNRFVNAAEKDLYYACELFEWYEMSAYSIIGN